MPTRSTMWLLGAIILFAAAPAAAQRSSCVDCHVANLPKRDVNPFVHGHVSDWEGSVHGRHGIGCERCHGGDATTLDAFAAHFAFRRTGDPINPANRRNLTAICGTCHAGPYREFQKSHHYAELTRGNPNVPTCSTCHGAVAAELPSPKELENRCMECHGPGTTVARHVYPIAGRVFLEEVRRVRVDLESAQKAIDRLKNAERRGAFVQRWQQAEVPLIQAIRAGHQFKLADADERLSVARARAGRIIEELQQSAR